MVPMGDATGARRRVRARLRNLRRRPNLVAIADIARRKLLPSTCIQRHMDGNGHWVDNVFVLRQWRMRFTSERRK